MPEPVPAIPVGPTTIVGYGGTVVGLIASILVLIFPEGDEQTIALVASSLFTLGSFLVTQIGRYLQAKELAKVPAARARNPAPVVATGSGTGVNMMKQWAPPEPATSDPQADMVGDEDLPTDAEEFEAPPPDHTNMPVQPSQAGFTNGESE